MSSKCLQCSPRTARLIGALPNPPENRPFRIIHVAGITWYWPVMISFEEALRDLGPG